MSTKDLLSLQKELPTDFIGRPLHLFKELESTNDTARELAIAGAPEGTAIIADSQSKGRGRQNRNWFSPAGANLYTSIILRPRIPAEKAPQITLAAAVAAVEAISEHLKNTCQSISIKWPNDILINQKKCGGILTEMKTGPGGVDFVILGIGININTPANKFPAELEGVATSMMAEEGLRISRADITQTLYSKIETWYKTYLSQGFYPLMQEWNLRAGIEGKTIRAASGEGYVTGKASGIDEEGALILEDNAGQIKKISSGETFIIS